MAKVKIFLGNKKKVTGYKMYVGAVQVSKMYVGSTEVTTAYVGSTALK